MMKRRRLLQMLLFLFPATLAGELLWSDPAAPRPSSVWALPVASVFISAPRQTIPAPVHNEAICAFCQAVAFAPHAARPAASLPEAWQMELRELLSYDDRLTHYGSSRPPRSRAPPILRAV